MDEIQGDGPVNEEVLVDLIERAQQDSDPEAFDSLYLLYADRIYRYLRAQLGNVETAEDITTQVFIRLIEKIGTYNIHPKDNVAVFTSWLYSIARNKMIDALRAEKRYRYVEQEYARQLAQNRSLSLNDRFDYEQIVEKLRCLIRAQREVITLRFIEGFNIAETAKIMHKTEAAVKALQQRALENLRQYRND